MGDAAPVFLPEPHKSLLLTCEHADSFQFRLLCSGVFLLTCSGNQVTSVP
jgi:hypothetical protein